VKNAAAPGRDVIEIISPPPGPNRNQCVDPAGMCTRVPGAAEAAERALVSRATVYRYFPTQESLLLGDISTKHSAHWANG
jgi:hypothetical protein